MSDSELFFETASIDYPIIDSDAHVNEPPELWVDRLPNKWRSRAPQVTHSDGGDLWIFDGGKEKWPVGLTATAGLSYFQYRPAGATYEEMRPGSFETKARLEDLDAARAQRLGRVAQVPLPAPAAQRNHRWMLEEEECVRALAAATGRQRGLLQRESLRVGDATQILDEQPGAGSRHLQVELRFFQKFSDAVQESIGR